MSDAETAGAIAAEVVEAAVIEAQDAEQRANETAEAIAAAAMETERGARVEALERDVRECRTILDSLPEMLAAKTAELIQSAATALRLELSTEMNSLLSVAVAGLAQSQPTPSSTPPISEVVEPVVVDPATGQPLTPETLDVPDPEKKKRHRFL